MLILTRILHQATVENTPEMDSNTDKTKIPDEIITSKIYVIRDIKVMLDEDLAELYNVTTGNLNKAVKMKCSTFP